MPTRFLDEKIRLSDDISALDWFSEVLFYRLIVSCDDFGRYDGRVPIIKNYLFPLKDDLTFKQVRAGLNKLASVGLIELYEVDGRPFLHLPSWTKYQNVRAQKSKYPDPPENKCKQMKTNENKCMQMSPYLEDECVCDIRYSSNSAERDKPASPPVVALPLNDGSFFDVTAEMVEHWAALYQAVDVMQELRNMVGWLESNPQRRKTRQGVMRFITAWLARVQDKGGNNPTVKPTKGKQQPGNGNAPSYDLDEFKRRANSTPKYEKRSK